MEEAEAAAVEADAAPAAATDTTDLTVVDQPNDVTDASQPDDGDAPNVIDNAYRTTEATLKPYLTPFEAQALAAADTTEADNPRSPPRRRPTRYPRTHSRHAHRQRRLLRADFHP